MHSVVSNLLIHLANASDSGQVINNDVRPFVTTVTAICIVICTLYLMFGGFRYISSAGNPGALLHAKKIIKHSIIGLVIVLAAATLSNFLSSSYGSVSNTAPVKDVPALSAVKPENKSSGIVEIIIKAIAGVLNNIIQTVATPFLKALSFFTTKTPLIEANPSAFNIWLIITGIADGLFTLVIILLGLHVMSFSSLGLDEVNLSQLLPRIGIAYLLINSSIFLIDAVISLSNMMIQVVSQGQSTTAVWQALTQVVEKSAGLGLAALIVMIIFLVFSVILMIYYVGRLVTLYLGGVLAPLIILVWLLPGMRDFAITASKKYLTLIFVLFVHVVILELAASIILSIVNGSTDTSPLMAMIIGIATLVCLLKTQGVMSQLSFAAIGPKTARQIGQRLILNMNYMGRGTISALAPVIPALQGSRGELQPSKYSSYSGNKSLESGNPTTHKSDTKNSPNKGKSK